MERTTIYRDPRIDGLFYDDEGKCYVIGQRPRTDTPIYTAEDWWNAEEARHGREYRLRMEAWWNENVVSQAH